MLEKVCLDLYAKEQQQLEKQQKTLSISTATPPIHIINTLPTSSCQTYYLEPSQATTASSIPSIDILGFQDKAVEKYCA